MSKRLCQGGFDNIYDMVGNVEEWVDFCRRDPMRGNMLVCGVMGGPLHQQGAGRPLRRVL
jgi:hypothetical protein